MLGSVQRRTWKPLAQSIHSFTPYKRSITSSHRLSDPLRILFCGSDEFSNHSLRALNELKQAKPDKISSIEVLCRPDKRTGRGLKHVHEVPIKSLAQSLELPLHQIDTFKGWSPPSHFDLVVAVSFGLLVPPRILNTAKYGGLNVHPSLLPDLRGPAPIQHALLQRRTHTGVTLQTMHPSKFDHGKILSQTSLPGIEIPEDATVDNLVNRLGPLGAKMLKDGISKDLYLHPEQADNANSVDEAELTHAPKITSEDAHVNWSTWPAGKISRYGRVLDLWDTTTYRACTGKEPLRVKFKGPWRVLDDSKISSADLAYSRPGSPFACRVEGEKGWVFAVETINGYLMSPESASVESKEPGRGLQVLVQGLQAARKNSRL
ncbi:putative formyl transferase [Septoria linicola]|nr:putative formyl transferase [Septoria linicola]